jgi:iron complex outermembrane receptor protein
VQKNDYGSESASKITWRVGLDYQLTSDQMLYGYVATGYKAGSFNDIDPTSATHGPAGYGPESMTAYEVGYKAKIARSLEIDTAAYYYDYSKFQLTGITFLAPNLSGGAPIGIIFTHVVPVELYGWEGELHWRLTQNDLVDLTLAVENGFFRGGANHATAGIDYQDQVDWSGKRLDNLPPLSSMVSYEHRFPITGGAYVSARVSSKISGGYYETDMAGVVAGPPFAPAGTPYALPPTQYYQRPFTRTDFNLGFTSASGKLAVNAFVRNIEDKMQLQGPPLGLAAGNVYTDEVTVPINAPRTMGVRVTLRY